MDSWDYNEKNGMELWDIFNSNRELMPYKKPRKSELSDSEYHIAVRMWIVNSQGMILLSLRNSNKSGSLLWECTGGSVISGESRLDAAVREVYEELGITLDSNSAKLISSERRGKHHDFYDIWLFKKDIKHEEFKLDLDEVVDVKWVTIIEFDQMCKEGYIMPTLSFFSKIYQEEFPQYCGKR
jgi:isopentenyldiphosphate isomerase